MLRRGDADAVEISTEAIPRMQDDFSVHIKPGAQLLSAFMNVTWEGFLEDIRVREALVTSIDRDLINDAIFNGAGVPTGIMDYGSYAIGYQPVPPPAFDPDRARQLLEEAVPDGVTITLYVVPRAGVPEIPDVAEVVATMWRDVGVNVEMRDMDSVQWHELWGQFVLKDSAGIRPTGNRAVYSGSQLALYSTDGRLSIVHDPVLDAMIEENLATVDADLGAQRTWEIAKYIADNFYTTGILELGWPWAANTDVLPEWDLGRTTSDLGFRTLVQP